MAQQLRVGRFSLFKRFLLQSALLSCSCPEAEHDPQLLAQPGRLAGGACAPSARRRLAWFVRPHQTHYAASVDEQTFLRAFVVYHEAFAEHEPARRLELLASSMTPDAQIWGPKRVFAGY